MVTPASASESESAKLKEEGNAFYKAGEYLKAAAAYTKAIKADETNAVLYRCGEEGRGPRSAFQIPVGLESSSRRRV